MDIYVSIPNEFGQQMAIHDIEKLLKLNFIIDQYRQGNVSLQQSYQCLNMNEVEFLTACHERGVARQTYADEQELELEFNQVLQHYQEKTVRL